MIKQILVPTDGSEHALKAVDVASSLAKKYDARLILLHVVFRGGDIPKELYKKASIEFEEIAKKTGKAPTKHPDWGSNHQVLDYMGQMILDTAERAAQKTGVTQVEKVMDYGENGERILYWAKREHVDLIVMGSRGYGELESLLLGSVSHKVYQLAMCTCVTVREAQGAAGIAGDIKTVLVPTDGSDHAQKAISLASDIAAKYGARVVLLHLLLRGATLKTLYRLVQVDELSQAPQEELKRLAKHPSIPSTVSVETLREIGRQILEAAKQVAQEKGVTDVSLVIEDGDAAKHILECAQRENVDLIAMGNRGLGELKGLLVGSVSNKVNHLAKCTCITVR